MWFYRWYGVVISCAWRRVWMIVYLGVLDLRGASLQVLLQ